MHGPSCSVAGGISPDQGSNLSVSLALASRFLLAVSLVNPPCLYMGVCVCVCVVVVFVQLLSHV